MTSPRDVLREQDVIEAVKRLSNAPDYKLVCRWLDAQSRQATKRLMSGPATDEAFVLLGQARAFDYLLNFLRVPD